MAVDVGKTHSGEEKSHNPNSVDVVCVGSGTKSDVHWSKKEKLVWMITFFIGNILLYSARSAMSICVPAMSRELGWSKTTSGMALSAFFAGYLCTNMIGGHFADQIGGEIIICYAGIGWATMTAVLPYVARLDVLVPYATLLVVASRFATGLSQGVFYPSMSAITAKRIVEAEKGFFAGFTTSGASIGSAATGFFGSILLEKHDWAYVFIIIGSMAILWILFLRYLISFQKESPVTEGTKPKERLPFFKLIYCSPFWGLFIAFFTSNYCFYNMLSWTPVYFHDTYPDGQAWLFNSIPWLVAFLFSNISGYVGNLLNRRGVSVTHNRKLFASFQLLSYTFCSLSINYATTFHQALIIMSLNIASNGFRNCSLNLNSQDLVPSHAGALHGFMNGSGAVAGVIGVYITGYILKITGKWSAVFLLNSILTFIGWVTFMVFGSGEPLDLS